jgi:hypothetical protein
MLRGAEYAHALEEGTTVFAGTGGGGKLNLLDRSILSKKLSLILYLRTI